MRKQRVWYSAGSNYLLKRTGGLGQANGLMDEIELSSDRVNNPVIIHFLQKIKTWRLAMFISLGVIFAIVGFCVGSSNMAVCVFCFLAAIASFAIRK